MRSYGGGVIFIACAGHCISHAKHCIQSFSRAGSDFRSETGCPGESARSSRETGQTSKHTPSPTHTSRSTALDVPWIPFFSGGSSRVPRLYGHYVHLQLAASLKIRVNWQKIHRNYFSETANITGCSQDLRPKAFWVSQHKIMWFV